MNIFRKDKKNNFLNLFLNSIIGVLIFFIIVAIFATILIFAYLVFEKKYEARIYPGVYLKNMNLSGMTYEEASEEFKKEISLINQEGILFYYYDFNAKASNSLRKTTLYPLVSSFSGDIAYEIIDFDINKSIEQAFKIGRNNSFIENAKEKINAYMNGIEVGIYSDVNELEVEKILKAHFGKYEIPAVNAKLLKGVDVNKNIVFSVTKEKNGYIINYKNSIEELKENLAVLSTAPIELISVIDTPVVYQEDGLKAASRANEILSFAPFLLSYSGNSQLNIFPKEWKISRNTLADWLIIKKGFSRGAQIGFNGVVHDFLEKEVAPFINVEPLDAKLEVKNGKVVEFQTGKDGLFLDTNKTVKNLEDRVINRKHSTIVKETNDAKKIEVIHKEVIAKHTNDINDMGIKEVIGIGKSDFTGSPFNRRHNIKTGINALNGIIIAPKEEFSLIEALGDIDDVNGYLPELVIKSGKTIPEFGGGLCQVGTTLFRTVLASGLPVTQRRNHSYRVGYYEPAGTDATIYDPWPDFRFKNDTEKYLLLQTYMEENELRFELWGTQDGRVASTTYPVIYNIVEPGPKKIIETIDLEPGKEKCTESAHAGADAYFDYFVKYLGGEKKERRFKSHYVPWQEVCLVGVEELSASSTKEDVMAN